MRILNPSCVLLSAAGLLLSVASSTAKPKQAPVSLTAEGQQLEKQYETTFKSLQADIIKSLPPMNAQKKSALLSASEAARKATAEAEAAQKNLGAIGGAKALIEHAKGKWIGGAEKGIAQAETALKNAKTDTERDAAKRDIAKWQANKQDGLNALKERQANYDKAKADEPKLTSANEAAKAALTKTKAAEMEATKSLLSDLAPVLDSDKLDAKLARCTVIAMATPTGLAEFAQQGKDKEAFVAKLLADDKLMKDMLVAGGANFGKYGRAMEIHTAILKASPKAASGNLQRLALAVSLEHAQPVERSNPKNQTNAPASIDPVKRYLHYEKAFLDGELDPAFKDFTAWEYRHVVACDAPDEILAWGREMLRNYRPDHIQNPDYGWRYVSAVKTEVPYGSQNVQYDKDHLQQYQNIIQNGGICGRRAFFGRFILRAFGIPTWGVTQKAHAALSHWTPKGWVVNLGAGYEHSWWDKGDVSMSGSQFLLETQARAYPQAHIKVLRSQWISRILGEEAYNERKKIEGGFWSSVANLQSIAIASKAISLGPLGQELAEANEPQGKQKPAPAVVPSTEQSVTVKDGVITIPAVASGKPAAKSIAMKGYSGGMQLHALGGFKTEYEFDAPQDGKYTLTARVATVQEGQKFHFTTNGSSSAGETPVPYTLGRPNPSKSPSNAATTPSKWNSRKEAAASPSATSSSPP
jgi:hypothetical protein